MNSEAIHDQGESRAEWKLRPPERARAIRPIAFGISLLACAAALVIVFKILPFDLRDLRGQFVWKIFLVLCLGAIGSLTFCRGIAIFMEPGATIEVRDGHLFSRPIKFSEKGLIDLPANRVRRLDVRPMEVGPGPILFAAGLSTLARLVAVLDDRSQVELVASRDRQMLEGLATRIASALEQAGSEVEVLSMTGCEVPELEDRPPEFRPSSIDVEEHEDCIRISFAPISRGFGKYGRARLAGALILLFIGAAVAGPILPNPGPLRGMLALIASLVFFLPSFFVCVLIHLAFRNRNLRRTATTIELTRDSLLLIERRRDEDEQHLSFDASTFEISIQGRRTNCLSLPRGIEIGDRSITSRVILRGRSDEELAWAGAAIRKWLAGRPAEARDPDHNQFAGGTL